MSNKKIKLYRFEKFTSARLDSIRNKELRFSSPNEFNDLNDCYFHLEKTRQNIFKSNDLHLAMEALYKNVDFNNEYDLYKLPFLLWSRENPEIDVPVDGGILKAFLSGLLEGVKPVVAPVVNEYIRSGIRKKTGVCCFFGVAPENQLMWAHYAENHNGFCTEYTIEIPEELPSIGPYSVNYTSDWPLRVCHEELVFSPVSTFTRIVTTKGIDWAHEKEYRYVEFDMLNNEPGRNLKWPKGLEATRIIAGERMKGNELFKLKDLADYLNLEFTQMTRESFS